MLPHHSYCSRVDALKRGHSSENIYIYSILYLYIDNRLIQLCVGQAIFISAHFLYEPDEARLIKTAVAH